MSRWRPSPINCLYTIPSINGRLHAFERIAGRIFPLRKSDGGEDHLFILGNLWGSNIDNKKLIERLIQLSTVPRVHILRGRVEEAFLKNHNDFLIEGGYKIMASYWTDANPNIKMEELFGMDRHRLIAPIPHHHIEFLQALPSQIEFNGYCFSNESTVSQSINVMNGPKINTPLITDRSIQLNCGAEDEVIVVDLQSLKGMKARQSARLVEFDL